jgi:hypothetical protein
VKINIKAGAFVTAASALAIAVPAMAHPGPSEHPSGSHSSGSHKCTPHKAAYIESGIVDGTTASTLAQNPDGTWTGTLVVDVTRTNHRAKADKGTTVTYTFTNQKLRVRFDGGTSGFVSPERVRLIGKLEVVGKKCPSITASPTFRMVVVHPAATKS